MRAVVLNTPRLQLPGVTLVAATSVALAPTERALRLSLAQVDFGACVWASDHAPASIAEVAWHPIAPLRSREAYSRFMLHELRDHVATGHVLCVQWDGYVLDAGGWDPAFLAYDYIGAPWPHFGDGHVVGNGGFSLRSRRLLDACHAMRIEGSPEDVAICRTHRVVLERDYGVRFAPEALARRFAFERHPREAGQFGFHGVFNLARLIDANELYAMLIELEPGVMSRGEHRELLRLALRRGNLRLARTLFERLRDARTRRR